MIKTNIYLRFIILLSILILIGLWRIYMAAPGYEGWANFSPLGAIALFAATFFSTRFKSYGIPLLILFMSDVILMQTYYKSYLSGLLYEGWFWNYAGFMIMVLVGDMMKKYHVLSSLLIGGFLAGIAHFLVSNFGVWVGRGTNLVTGLPYELNFLGLLNCYLAGIPFLKNLILGNYVFGSILFGIFKLIEYNFIQIPIKSPNEIKNNLNSK